jgi:hypothetical protein
MSVLRALPVIHAPAREKAQQLLLLMLLEVGVDVGGNKVRLMGHLNAEFGKSVVSSQWKEDSAPLPLTTDH